MTNQLITFKESVFADPKKRAIAALAIAVIIFSFIPILVKFGENEISSTAVIFHRFWIAAIIQGLWNGALSLRRKNLNLFQVGTNHTLKLLLGSGICFAVTQLLWVSDRSRQALLTHHYYTILRHCL